jgi:hypothetical protein
MLRIAVILLIICVLWRWALGKWPWQMLGGPPNRAARLKQARKLLGVPRVSSREDILAAHKRVMASVHPDRGGSSAQVHEANEARDLLLGELPPAAPAPVGAESEEDGEPQKDSEQTQD